MNKLLYADSAGHQMQKLYGQSHVALAALVPASLLSPKDSIPATLADVGLSVAIPFHSQVALNYGETSVVVSPSFYLFLAIYRCLFSAHSFSFDPGLL